ncbi:DMT family transporter [Aminicella lysinilytica]|uniref:DMT family transporter n=1 Tax=Aminicella lysinilytica TaxID=433323 RepID=UPI0017D2B25F|nr:DMT family transporter [Aminicella lysinilytica]NLD11055.1 DMT family transporter [Clostridiales bacterium]
MIEEKTTVNKSLIFVLFVFLGLFWGMSFFATTVALELLTPIQILAIRWAVSALIFLVLIAAGKIKIKIKKGSFRFLLLTGLLQPCVYSIFETNGIAMTSTSESSIFIATIPCATLIFGAAFFNRKVNYKVVLSIIIAFAGVVICTVFSPDFTLSGKGSGYLMLLGAIVTGGLYSHSSSKAGETYNTLEVTAVISIMGGIFFNVISLAKGYGFSGYAACFSSARMTFSVLFLGVCCSCLCYLIFNYVLSKMKPAIATNISANSTTAVGVISGVLFAGDPSGWFTIVGLALTITGVWLSSREA